MRTKVNREKQLDAALNIATKWLDAAGGCTHYPGYTCDKDFTQSGVCAACLRRHFLKMAREEMSKKR